ncbi:MAG: hypothetical protein ABIM40_15725, partial [Pseudomonadota bacterium]
GNPEHEKAMKPMGFWQKRGSPGRASPFFRWKARSRKEPLFPDYGTEALPLFLVSHASFRNPWENA